MAYVGDRRYDMEAAKNAGVLAVGAISDPYADEDELRLARADIVVKEPHDIVEPAKDCYLRLRPKARPTFEYA